MMDWSELRAIVFDLDGVIVDSNPVHEDVWRTYLRRFGTELNGAMLNFIPSNQNS